MPDWSLSSWVGAAIVNWPASSTWVPTPWPVDDTNSFLRMWKWVARAKPALAQTRRKKTPEIIDAIEILLGTRHRRGSHHRVEVDPQDDRPYFPGSRFTGPYLNLVYDERFDSADLRRCYRKTVTPLFSLTVHDLENVLPHTGRHGFTAIPESFYRGNRKMGSELSQSSVPLLLGESPGRNPGPARAHIPWKSTVGFRENVTAQKVRTECRPSSEPHVPGSNRALSPVPNSQGNISRRTNHLARRSPNSRQSPCSDGNAESVFRPPSRANRPQRNAMQHSAKLFAQHRCPAPPTRRRVHTPGASLPRALLPSPKAGTQGPLFSIKWGLFVQFYRRPAMHRSAQSCTLPPKVHATPAPALRANEARLGGQDRPPNMERTLPLPYKRTPRSYAGLKRTP